MLPFSICDRLKSMNKNTVFLRVALFLLILALASCLNQGSHSLQPKNDDSTLKLLFKTPAQFKLQNIFIDSIQIRMTKDQSIEFNQRMKFEGDEFTLTNLTPGEKKKLEVFLYDSNQTLTYQCTKDSVTIVIGQTNEVSVNCIPEFSILKINFPLGLNNPDKISQGNLKLIHGTDTLTSPLTIVGELGLFELLQVKGDVKYEIQINLKTVDGTTVYQEETDSLLVVKGQVTNLEIFLKTTQGKLFLSLNIPPTPLIQASASPINGLKRSPQAKEIIFSEFYPSPTVADGNSQGEWIEIYNRTHDTLQLGNCKISKTKGSNSTTTSTQIESGSLILPGQALVFGKDSVKFRDLPSTMNLVDTKQSILFVCHLNSTPLVIDSIAYTLEYLSTDSIAAETNKVSTLNPYFIGQNAQNANWCLTQTESNTQQATPKNIYTSCN